MGVFAERVDEVVANNAARCKLGSVMDDFDDDDLDRFTTLARAERFSQIVELLDKRVGVRLVSLHARGQCVCQDDAPGKGVTRG